MNSKVWKMIADKMAQMPDESMVKDKEKSMQITIMSGGEESEPESEKSCSDCGKLPCECE